MEKLPLEINEVSHYYCNVIQEIWLIVSIQDEALAYRCIIIGCGPVDYNPPLKGHTFSESLFLRLKMDLWDVC